MNDTPVAHYCWCFGSDCKSYHKVVFHVSEYIWGGRKMEFIYKNVYLLLHV